MISSPSENNSRLCCAPEQTRGWRPKSNFPGTGKLTSVYSGAIASKLFAVLAVVSMVHVALLAVRKPVTKYMRWNLALSKSARTSPGIVLILHEHLEILLWVGKSVLLHEITSRDHFPAFWSPMNLA
ncbi:hypothetical protein ETB97_011951 [Aspergillus alliaceus]|uniref:Uncharacterized protein n=1 Tax=Petromyces alliaceus TaxID=209559 RepID=A0A8H6EBF0_PETAA|nr:hypothetical protein ETB97_011951 [Aspergillus burnettii]